MAAPTVRELLRATAVDANITLTTGAGTAVDDVLVVIHGSDFFTASTMASPTPGTWTLAATGDLGSNNSHLKVWTRPVTSAGVQTVTMPKPGDNDHGVHLYVVSGADPADPVDDATGTTGTASTSHVAPSISPTNSDALMISAVIAAVNSFGDYSAVSGGMTDLVQDDLTPEATFSTMASARQALVSSGPTGTRTFTYSQSRAFAAVSVALKAPAGSEVDLTVADASHSHAVDATTLAQVHGLAPVAAAHVQTATAPQLSQTHLLGAGDAGQAHLAGEVALTQAHQLVVQDAGHGQTATSPLLAGGTTLVVADAAHGHSVVVTLLAQEHLLGASDSNHGQAATGPVLGQAHELLVLDGIHSHIATIPQLIVPGAVVQRPNTGTVARPDTGVVVRPDTGVITRP